MGAWGEGPFESGSALDWMVETIERPIVRSIEQTLKKFLAVRVQQIKVSVLDPAKRKEYEAWKKVGRKRRESAVRRRRYTDWGSRSYKKWRKKWESFHNITTRPGRPWGHHETEAAAAVLDALTPYSRVYYKVSYFKPKKFSFGLRMGGKRDRVTSKTPGARQRHGDSPAHIQLQYEAEVRSLYTLAVRAIQALLDDEWWVGSWRSPEKKRKELLELLGSLKRKARNERTDEDRALARKFSCRRRPRPKGWRRRRVRRHA